MHKFLKFIFGRELYMFRAGFLYIVTSLVLYTQHIGICHIGDADCLLAGSGRNTLILLASSQYHLYDIYLLLCIQY
jgi:hypothetical protein